MEDEEMSADDNPTKAYEVSRLHTWSYDLSCDCHVMQLYSKKKAELLLKQGQLADRGAPVMVLEVITASHGRSHDKSHDASHDLYFPPLLQAACRPWSTLL